MIADLKALDKNANAKEVVLIVEDGKGLNSLIQKYLQRASFRTDGAITGDAIPITARIIHVADSYDAMTSDRPYRLSPGKEFAISEFKKFSGIQFDPEAVDAFLDIVETH
jgi:hypothetical protein